MFKHPDANSYLDGGDGWLSQHITTPINYLPFLTYDYFNLSSFPQTMG